MQRQLAFWATAVLVATSSAVAGEIGFVEDFSLAGDRTEALKTLIPGSEDYYYFHCLHYQQVQQFGKVDELLKLWIERYKDSPRLREVQNRQALLTYEAHPQQTLEFLRQRLGLRFDHQRIALGAQAGSGHAAGPGAPRPRSAGRTGLPATSQPGRLRGHGLAVAGGTSLERRAAPASARTSGPARRPGVAHSWSWTISRRRSASRSDRSPSTASCCGPSWTNWCGSSPICSSRPSSSTSI